MTEEVTKIEVDAAETGAEEADTPTELAPKPESKADVIQLMAKKRDLSNVDISGLDQWPGSCRYEVHRLPNGQSQPGEY